MHSPRLAGRAAIVLAGVMLARCSIPAGPLNGRAADEWTHRYPLARGGTVRIGNTMGLIEVETGAAGDVVEVRAERVARAVTEAAARDLLPRIAIKEDVKPDVVAIETEKMN